jgi:FdhD protein
MLTEAARAFPLTTVAGNGEAMPGERLIAVEAPVAIEINGIGYAVMMATPTDLHDFAAGFARNEGLGAPDALDIVETDKGWIARLGISGAAAERVLERARARVSESGCGLCGLENLEALAAPLPPVAPHDRVADAAIFAALGALADHQPLGRATGGTHAAAWADQSGTVGCAREDVGRHNALDKLVGAMARAGRPLSPGFVLVTSRCSYELVEKAVRAGATTLVAISVPTSLAIDRARAAGLSLVALARPDRLLRFNPL